MMIPERMTSAAGVVGLARAALEVAAKYSDKRKAFGRKIREFEGVSFRIADSVTKLDAASTLVYGAATAVDAMGSTEAAWEIINNAMQVVGGIGYTNVYPLEKMLRDARLSIIWTGTSEIMNLIIQHEYYRETLAAAEKVRNVEDDAQEAHAADEKIYE
jgi:alkylation response protein AidB-like acyl-CoA dehydrogenase